VLLAAAHPVHDWIWTLACATRDMVLLPMQVQQAVAVALRHCDASDAAALPHITQLFHLALQVLPL
jgi:hypothetical protein